MVNLSLNLDPKAQKMVNLFNQWGLQLMKMGELLLLLVQEYKYSPKRESLCSKLVQLKNVVMVLQLMEKEKFWYLQVTKSKYFPKMEILFPNLVLKELMMVNSI